MTVYKSTFLSCDFDFDVSGKNYGSARLDYSDDLGVSRVFPIPIATISNGSGPTILLTAGNHGNEDEGQLILRRLIHELDPTDICGRIIILPALNYPAVRSNRRTSPLDNGNLNRSFPGDPEIGPTSAIARFVVDQLLPLADAGIDFHSGGRAAKYVTTSFLCTCSDPEIYRKSFDLAEAFDAPYLYVVDGTKSKTGFDPVAHDRQVPFISNELGGGWIDREAVQIGYRGIQNVLKFLDIVPESEKKNDDRKDTIYLDAVNTGDVLYAPYEGIFEARVELGQRVEAGQTAGALYSLDEVARAPKILKFAKSGIVCVKAISARVVHGSRLFVTAESVAAEEILGLSEV